MPAQQRQLRKELIGSSEFPLIAIGLGEAIGGVDSV
jgi:hypothetical protein